MAVLSGKGRAALPDSAFAYIEPGHEGEKVGGKTPDKWRHYPVHDAPHVRNALSRIAQGTRFGSQAKAKVLAAAKAHGVDHDESSETGRSLESLFPEVRFIKEAPEFRMVEGGGTPHITGYAAVFGKLSRRLGGFMEVIEPRAFDASRDAGFPGVVCRYNHRDDMVLGTTDAGTLRIEVDERGMHYDVDPPKTRADVLELVERRDVRYSSFAFVCEVPGEDDSWGVTLGDFPLRSLRKVNVKDTAPVLDPAYFDTSAAARSMTGAVESLARWVDVPVDEARSYLAAGQAVKFFRRTDRPSAIPVLDHASAEGRMMDDTAVALRNWRFDDDAPAVAAEEASPGAGDPGTGTAERVAPAEAELRAALTGYDDLCRMWTGGEPCVRPKGHDDEDGCAPACWMRSGGLPCSRVMGHEGEHEPMRISGSRDAGGQEGAETRDGAEIEGAADGTTCDQDAGGQPCALPYGHEDGHKPAAPAERGITPAQMGLDIARMRQRQMEFERELMSA